MSGVKLHFANKTDREALQEWEDLLATIRNSTPVDINETPAEKKSRIKKLEADPEAWIKYYFPKYCFCEPAGFQKKSFKRILKADKGFFQRRSWFRGAAKSTRRMMEVFYIKFARKFRVNALLLSKNNENAVRLLNNYMAELEANQRLINDYGVQEKAGKWTQGEFTTRDGSTFRAVGAGQNPRGAKDGELRINMIIFDDIDDDEVCRNPDRLQQTQDWIEQAVIPTVDISSMYYIFFDNNIIAEDSLAVRAAEYADDVELVNIRDEDGKSTWPEKNSETDIDGILSKISYESGQKEYFNNPMSQGKSFPEITYGKCPAIKTLPYVVAYADPGTSNKDKPTGKSKANNSSKSLVLLGCVNSVFYVYKCWVDHTSNSNFIDWLFAGHHYVNNATQLFTMIENNSLQDPFYEQVFLPLIFSKSKEFNTDLLITPDTTKKPDKWVRIEGTLEPLNRLGRLVFNQDEKENPHMKRMEAQFKAAKATSKKLDGPDAVQGGVKIIQDKVAVETAGGMQTIPRPKNNKRF